MKKQKPERLWELRAYLPQHIIEFINGAKKNKIILLEMACLLPENLAEPKAKVWTSLSKKELQRIARKVSSGDGLPILESLKMIGSFNRKTKMVCFHQTKALKSQP